MHWHTEGKKCCADCFAHPWLKQKTQRLSQEIGLCRYCGSENGKLVEVAALSNYFENLLTLYAPSNSPHGDPLTDLLQNQWEVFSDPLYESGKAPKLVEDIMLSTWDDDDGEPPLDAHELYVRVGSSLDYLERFDMFLQDARETPDADPDFPDALTEDIWRFENVIPAGTILYRARRGYESEERGDKRPWTGRNIGPNPAGPAGRANRAGKVVLYCADHRRTAIAEIRPTRGLLVSICELRTTSELRILDLTRPREVINPFLASDGLLPYWLELEELLDRIAWALAKPLERDDNPLDYVPSQRLSEFAEQVHFHGIRYPSAMDQDGTNLVIFDPTMCDVLESRLVKITALTVEYTDQLWRLTDDSPELRTRETRQ